MTSEFIERLRAAQTRRELAEILGIKESSLTYILYFLEESEKYKKFSIPKKGGGEREICAPDPRLKNLQRKVANILSEVFDCSGDGNESEIMVNTSSHGYRSGRSIYTNANPHRRKRFVFNVDIENFFGNIGFPRVYGFFLKNNRFKLRSKIAATLAHIICTKEGLPQGSPCSPVMSNLIGGALDFRLSKLAERHGCTYTRYVDDLSFSTNKTQFPVGIAFLDEENGVWVPGKDLLSVIRRSGFSLNNKKTRMSYKDSRQIVTGLVVNRKVSVPVEYRRRVRAYVHRLIKEGQYFVRNDQGVEFSGNVRALQGMMNYILHAERLSGKKLPDSSGGRGCVGFHRVYRDYLFYTRFFNPANPFVICEGKTDPIHLKASILSKTEKFPYLVDGKGGLAISFFNHDGYDDHGDVKSGRISVSKALGVFSGGGPSFRNLIGLYNRFLKKYSKDRKDYFSNPVIMIFDNDKGGILDAIPVIRNNSDKKNGGAFNGDGGRDSEYFNPFGNLFIVPVPRKKSMGREDFDIESLHDDELRVGRLNEKGIVNNKVKFAMYVRDNAKSINFDGFEPILETISKIVKESEIRLERDGEA